MKTFWHRLVNRHKRIKTERAQLELQIVEEMAKKPPLIPVLAAFPRRPYKISTVILFAVFISLAAVALWVSFRELVLPLIR